MPHLPRARRAASAAVLLLLGALLAACGGSSDPLASQQPAPAAADTIRVGSANFTENRLLGEIYATALQIRGVKVERNFGIGSRETYFPALRDGSIDLIPDYTGNLLQYLDKNATATQPAEVYQQVTQKLPPNLKVLQPSQAQDKDAVVVTRAFAQQNNLRSIADLAPICNRVTFGGPPEFQTRPYGVPGIQRLYGCTFQSYRSLDAGGPLTVAALKDGTVQAADLFTTDSSIPENDFVALEDPKDNFAAQNVVPLITASKADPRVADVLNLVSSKLDTQVLTDLNRRLASPSKPDPAQVARDWLTSAGIG